ncbi:MAG: PTS sugar transporter subunit IIA [Treponema sp.]|jgi:fructose-specific phosphotransferase system IIA component|nr:PTS sugar transporter subunit IIA [Treponema sp.]
MNVAVVPIVIRFGILYFAIRCCRYAANKIGIPHFFGEFLAGIIIGPYALGGIALPGFPEGIFWLTNELYAIALLAAVTFFFVSGLRLNIRLFFRYSLAGSIIGFGGAVLAILFGDLAACLLLNTAFFSPQSLFWGILCMTASGGLSARFLSKNKKMNSPEGVAILSSAVFINVLGIIALALVYGILTISLGRSLNAYAANALLVAGAFITGLFLSKSRNTAIIQERLRGVYDFLTPFLFAIIGMMVNFRDIFTLPVLIFGAVYSLAVIIAKIIGCGGPALLLGFNLRGGLRIGTGMVPCGELSLIIAGLCLIQGIFNQQVFTAAVLMSIITSIIAAPLQNFSLKLSGHGTKRLAKGDDPVLLVWKFSSPKLIDLVSNMLLKKLGTYDFYIQMTGQNGSLQARKNDIAFSIAEEQKSLFVETAKTDLPFVKNIILDVINSLHDSVQELSEITDSWFPNTTMPANRGKTGEDVFSLITPDCISVSLRGSTKEEVIAELVDILANRRKLIDRDLVLRDILEREKTISTGMQRGIAIPHAKTEGVNALAVAVGTKKEGLDFESIDGSKARLIILLVSPKNTSGPHVKFLADISAVLKNDELKEAVINALTSEEVARLLRNGD